MFVSGFTFVRNAIQFDYPVKESITSLLPLVNELIVCCGNSTDETKQLITDINSDKIKIIDSIWDDDLRIGGRVLAEETNKAYKAINADADWAFYLQADEVIHEIDYEKITNAMQKYKDNELVEGLLFKYIHFYGSYKYVGNSRRWYRNEIRIIRNDKSITSYKDAQGFRKNNAQLKVVEIDAKIYHYGWVKNPYHQQEKQKNFQKLWHSDEVVKNKIKTDEYDYSIIDSLKLFDFSHPKVMHERIAKVDWDFIFDLKKSHKSIKYIFLDYYERLTGYRLFEYKNFKIIKTNQ